jgi:hypothetical protein
VEHFDGNWHSKYSQQKIQSPKHLHENYNTDKMGSIKQSTKAISVCIFLSLNILCPYHERSSKHTITMHFTKKMLENYIIVLCV